MPKRPVAEAVAAVRKITADGSSVAGKADISGLSERQASAIRRFIIPEMGDIYRCMRVALYFGPNGRRSQKKIATNPGEVHTKIVGVTKLQASDFYRV
jgi:hypothetical protein